MQQTSIYQMTLKKLLPALLLVALGLTSGSTALAQATQTPQTPQQETSGYLGIGLAKLTPPVRAHLPDNIGKKQGLIVMGLADISPAADDGIKQYDVLLSYDNEPIEDPQALINKIRKDKPGRIAQIKVLRQGVILDLPIKIGEQPKTKATNALLTNQSGTQRASQSVPRRPFPAIPYQQQARRAPYPVPNRPGRMPPPQQALPGAPRILNITGKPAYPMRKKPKVHAWGKKRNIWTDFYTGVTNDFWDKMINAPHDIGRMPGGWRAPQLSTPDPVTVGDAVTNQMPPFVEEMGNMMDFSKD